MVIKFHKKLYKKKSIEAAIRDYKTLADFILTEKEAYYWVEINNINKEVEGLIEGEFCNYVLAHNP